MTLNPILLYFVLAFMTQLLLAEHPPADWFGWLKWIGSSFVSGLIAVKAKISPPPKKEDAPALDAATTPPEIDAAINGGGSPPRHFEPGTT